MQSITEAIHNNFGRRIGYKCQLNIDGYHTTAFSFDSHHNALERAIKAIWDKIEHREGTNKAILLFKGIK